MNSSLPSYITWTPTTTIYQSITVTLPVVPALTGAKFYNHTNAIKTNVSTNLFFVTFTVTLYECQDGNCVTCDFDYTNITVGSKKCTQCNAGLTWDATKLSCINCGNGFLETNETCDDGGAGRCLADCSGPMPLYVCTGGDYSHPSVCVCIPGYSGDPCVTVCGDGFVAGTEVCDDGNLGGCLPDCSGT